MKQAHLKRSQSNCSKAAIHVNLSSQHKKQLKKIKSSQNANYLMQANHKNVNITTHKIMNKTKKGNKKKQPAISLSKIKSLPKASKVCTHDNYSPNNLQFVKLSKKYKDVQQKHRNLIACMLQKKIQQAQSRMNLIYEKQKIHKQFNFKNHPHSSIMQQNNCEKQDNLLIQLNNQNIKQKILIYESKIQHMKKQISQTEQVQRLNIQTLANNKKQLQKQAEYLYYLKNKIEQQQHQKIDQINLNYQQSAIIQKIQIEHNIINIISNQQEENIIQQKQSHPQMSLRQLVGSPIKIQSKIKENPQNPQNEVKLIPRQEQKKQAYSRPYCKKKCADKCDCLISMIKIIN